MAHEASQRHVMAGIAGTDYFGDSAPYRKRHFSGLTSNYPESFRTVLSEAAGGKRTKCRVRGFMNCSNTSVPTSESAGAAPGLQHPGPMDRGVYR
jgi:hypothetical protein